MPQPSWTPPSEFEEYRLIGRLGHGAMGQVWSAWDTLLNRKVALKFIGSLAPDAVIRERFLIEARAIARLSHPNVVIIHRIGVLEGQPFTVTELVEGPSLDLIDKPQSSSNVLRLGVDLARGLAAAHRAGILHRDIKPANALLSSSGAKLLDFGLAKFAPLDAIEADPAPPSFRESAPSKEVDPYATQPGAHAPKSIDASASPHLTQAGSSVGTPFYLAPECWVGEGASRRSDVYSLGALLYELSAGAPPVRYLPPGPLREVVAKHANRPLAQVAAHIDGRLAAVIDKCLRREPLERWASGDELRETLERLAQTQTARVPEGNPYRGLCAYDAEQRALFFGRDAEMRTALDRLRAASLLVVVGESGAGKSSLCRAGILPAIREGALGDGRQWQTLSCVPGRFPLRALAAACAPLLGTPELELHHRLLVEPGLLVRDLLRVLGPERGVLLFVDQLEEWATLADATEAELAGRTLAELASGLPSLKVLATARSDLLPSLTSLPGLGPELSNAVFLLGPVQAEHVRQLIEGPARATGVRFESSAMVDELVDFAHHGGPLPLLQFALARLWEERAGAEVLTHASLNAMGGVSGALARHADNVVNTLPAAQAAAAKVMVLSLVGVNGCRLRRLEIELVGNDASARAALSILARARLVLARDSAEGTGWEIAHEALLREWPTLERWLAEDGQAHAVRERLRLATLEWQRLGKPDEALWGAPRLADVERVTISPSADEIHFLSASKRKVRFIRWRLPLFVGALLAAGSLTFGLTRWNERRALVAKMNEEVKRAKEHLAQAHGARPLWESKQRDAFAAFDVGDYPAGELQWAEAMAQRDEWARGVALASVEIENALALVRADAEAQAVAIEVAQQQIALAHAKRNALEIEAATTRLATLGQTVDLRATARVSLRVFPEHAQVQLTREGEPEANAKPFDGPQSLSPGSWRFHVTAAGFAPAKLPFVAERAQDVNLELRLIPSAQLPEGFVYVPRGTSFFGAAGDDSVRRDFYEAPPLHLVDVPAFVMSRFEVTFGEWFNWLDVLPKTEREKHMPRVAANTGVAIGASLQVTQEGGKWVLHFTPVSQPYSAKQGEKLHYLERQFNADHDWLLLPVIGITPVDIEAYAQWLHASGRVPGARLCTEKEWERAARGADARTLPHGDVAAPLDGNVDVTYGRKDRAYGPDQVGLHPRSQSPFGVDDMFGNVWEVVRPASKLKAYVSKGGAWNVNVLAARIPNDWVINAEFRQVETGGRICASLPP